MSNPVHSLPLEARLRQFQERLENLQTEEESVAVLKDIALDREVFREIRTLDPGLAGHVDELVAQYWLPLRYSRIFAMAVMLAIGIIGAFFNKWLLLFLAAALLLSPRVVGLLANLFAKLKSSP